MPTGYTAKLHDGTDEPLSDFLAHLARGLGLYVTMRDDPNDAPLKMEVDNYRQRSLESSIQEYNKLKSMSDITIAHAFTAACEETDRSNAEYKARKAEIRSRYEARLEEIKSLEFPEGEFFNGLRKFAIEQIEESIEFDCSSKYEPKGLHEVYEGAQEWHESRVEMALKSLARDAEAAGEEIKRNREKIAAHEQFANFLDDVRHKFGEDLPW